MLKFTYLQEGYQNGKVILFWPIRFGFAPLPLRHPVLQTTASYKYEMS